MKAAGYHTSSNNHRLGLWNLLQIVALGVWIFSLLASADDQIVILKHHKHKHKHPKEPHTPMPARFIEHLRAGRPQTIVAYGTSLTEGSAWVKALADELDKQFPGLATVNNSAKAGMFSGWGLENFQERVLNLKPDCVFIEFAINDAYIAYNCSLDTARSNLEKMIGLARTHVPEIEVILETMNNPRREGLEDRPNFEQYYEMYRRVALAWNLKLIDHEPNWKSLFDQNPRKWWRFVPDGLHPNREGQLEVIVPELFAELGLRRKEEWSEVINLQA